MLFKSSQWLSSLFLALTIVIGAVPTDATADRFAPLFAEFDARGLTSAEKRFLQSALAFQGFYNGLLDGKWGRGSQRSLERYTIEKFGTEPGNVHMATLAFDFVEEVEREGWEIRYFNRLDMSFAFPTKTMKRDERYEKVEAWTHEIADFEIAIDAGPAERAAFWHAEFLKSADPGDKPYLLRASDIWVTSGRQTNGWTFYVRSDFRRSKWSSVILYASPENGNLLNGVASSISPGRALTLSFPERGELDRIVSLFFEWSKEAKAKNEHVSTSPAEPSTPASSDPERSPSSGSGFYVDLAGTVLTNAHVVEGCMTLRVDGSPARLIKASEEFDLAIIRAQPRPSGAPIARFAPGSAALNSDVTVIGYPLHGLLGGLNVTRGSVASLTGLVGDAKTMQISAPVQGGNSGGPVVDEAGRVIGVVVSKLDALKLANISGEIPQNINFAIRSEVAKLFLGANGIDYAISNDDEAVRPTALAKEATAYTVLIECN